MEEVEFYCPECRELYKNVEVKRIKINEDSDGNRGIEVYEAECPVCGYSKRKEV